MEAEEIFKIRTGTDQLDNDTFTECHNANEENTYTRHTDIVSLWKKTNFWLGCIGLYFLIKIIIFFVKIFMVAYIGQDIINLLLS